MMKNSLLVSVLLAATLAACSNTAVKEKPAAPVVDSSKSSQTTQPSAASRDDGASTAPAVQTEMSVNPLKDPNNILSKRSIFFDFDKDEIKAEYRSLVEAHAKYLVANPNAKVIFQGNADARGSREYNLSLGQRRSVAVKKAVNVLGAQDKQIETVSYGEEKAKECKDEACYQQDRRVEIVYENE
jgi:peptidoglycan-associated lipoprotein